MDELNKLVESQDTSPLPDKVAVMVVSGVAGLVAKHFVEKGMRAALATYRLKKAAASE